MRIYIKHNFLADAACAHRLYLNNKTLQDYQNGASLTYLLVEPKTGVTTKMFKNYQV